MAGLGGLLGTLATWLGVLSALGAFSRLPALNFRFSESGYVRFFDGRGSPVLRWANLRHDAEARRWRVDYEDDHRRRHSLETHLHGGIAGHPEFLEWVSEPEVGVWDLPRQTVHNAVPLGWVADLTVSPFRLRLAVRYTSGRSGDGEVNLEDLTSPNPNASPLLQRNGDLEAIPVRIRKVVNGREHFFSGRVFMSQPVTFWDHGVHTRMRGLYRLANRNLSFHVDYMDFVEAYTITKHQKQIRITNGHRSVDSEALFIEVDLTRSEPVVRLEFRAEDDRRLSLDVSLVTCPVTLLRYANL